MPRYVIVYNKDIKKQTDIVPKKVIDAVYEVLGSIEIRKMQHQGVYMYCFLFFPPYLDAPFL
jgi:hypothetical protein